MPHSMATTSSGETAGTRPTSSDPEKPKPFLLQLIPCPHHVGPRSPKSSRDTRTAEEGSDNVGALDGDGEGTRGGW